MEEIKAGDVVTLKHASTANMHMTVESISNGIAKCAYFLTGELKQVEIDVYALKKLKQ